jgi:hypothetical protein
VRDRQRKTAELYKVGKLQQNSGDYGGAWASFEQGLKAAEPGGQLAKITGQLDAEERQLREAQENLAMDWLENIRVIFSQGETFSAIADRLVPVLNRGVTTSSGARRADLLAHLGWADFLRWREGRRELNPERLYQQALEIDPSNPYAHAFWGHWKLWTNREAFEKCAADHFAVALASGRARDRIRKVQLAALRDLSPEGAPSFLALVNDMRKNKEAIDDRTRRDISGVYAFSCSFRYDADRLAKLLAAVPAREQIAIFQALFYDAEKPFDASNPLSRDACLAQVHEAAGERERALQIWLAVRGKMPPQHTGSLRQRADRSIKRLRL